MAARLPGFMIIPDQDEQFDLEHIGTRIRVDSIFVDEVHKELRCFGRDHLFGGPQRKITLGYEAGHRLTHYSDVITDDKAKQLIANHLSQGLAA